MLALATAGFDVSFWAWALLAPLAPTLRKELDLTSAGFNNPADPVVAPIEPIDFTPVG
ncbi:hypothetical protein [Streptomyces sp. NPDC018833]|uniref:hypothetical protein n=1 Tax=Streptomyces sp. NPDC018833 TaxID=3365053 RepID=UPI0037B362E6